MLKKILVMSLVMVVMNALCLIPLQAQGKYKVAIIKNNNRPNYLEGQEGIISGFKKLGFDESKIEFDIRNCEESDDKLKQIIKDLTDKKVDLILPLGTDVAATVCGIVKDIPVVFGQVADPVTAGFAKSLRSSGNNTTGTLTTVDTHALIKILKEITPIKRLGILYSENDIQSLVRKKELTDLQKIEGYTVLPLSLNNSDAAEDAIKSFAGRVDAVFIGSGNTIGGVIDVISATLINYKLPSLAGTSTRVEKGILVGLAADRFKLGELQAKKAVEILNGQKPTDIPIEPLGELDIWINLKTANAIGKQIPVSILKAATRIIKEK